MAWSSHRGPDPAVRRIQPAASLELAGEKYSLLYTFDALALTEQVTGMDLLSHHPAIYFRQATAAQIRGMLYAAMWADQEITVEQAGALLSPAILPSIFEALAKAWTLSMPEPKPDDRRPRVKRTLNESWESYYTSARVGLRFSDREFGSITPRQLQLLVDQEDEMREERRMLFGIVASTTANFSANRPDRMLTPSDFVGESRNQKPVPARQNSRQAKNEALRAFFMKRTTSVNERTM